MTDFLPIAQLIEERTGLTSESLGGLTPIANTIRRQMATRHLTSVADFQHLVLADETAWTTLVDALVVPETFFFRYPESFLCLARALTSLLATRERIRILSVPCSTGEEPYSIAMQIRESVLPADRVEITGIDISEAAIATARAASYRATSFRGLSEERKTRYFEASDSSWRLIPTIHDHVRFQSGNLFHIPLTADHWDIIFCRNLLIYLKPDAQQRILQILGNSLREDGVLFLAPAEAPLPQRATWTPMRHAMAFAFYKKSREMPAPAPAPRRSPAPAARRRPAPHTPPPATPQPSKKPEPPPEPTVPFETIESLANAGKLREAADALAAYHKNHPANANSHFLGGLLAETSGQLDEAEAVYRKALYLDPRHPGALSHLALLLESSGRSAAARQLRRRASAAQSAA